MKKTLSSNEAGSARLKFILVIAIIAGVAFVASKILPITYHAYVFKDLMQHNVDLAAAQGYPANWVRDQLANSLGEYEIPSDAVITPANRDGRIEVRVQFVQAVEFPGYTYQYEFDHTARSTAFLTVK